MSGITFQAYMQGAKTTPDGGWRVSLDLSGDEAQAVVQLNTFQQVLLQVAIIPVEATDATPND